MCKAASRHRDLRWFRPKVAHLNTAGDCSDAGFRSYRSRLGSPASIGPRTRVRPSSDFGLVRPLSPSSHRDNGALSHLNRGIDGVFELVRVVGRGLVCIAEVHAIVAGAQLAEGKPEMARNRFGFLERHEYFKEMSRRYLWRGSRSVSSADCCEV